ncbi:MAG: hypothetical protein IKG40_03610 [Bacilli bacterium]|nr:hypothetical protein [Bacilli bacterium]
MFIESILYDNGTMWLNYEKTDANGVIVDMQVEYDLYFGITCINNMEITKDNSYLLSDVINGAYEDLEKIGVI